MKRILLITVFAVAALPLPAQVPANPIGINPPSIKWRQIKTDKVDVIYPAGMETDGQRVANIAHYLWDHHNESIGERMTPITILLQNQPVISNGFVTPGPFRSEFYTTAPQFNNATDWVDVLAIHEYQHVKQFGNSKRGITNTVRSVLGSWPWGGLFGLALPRWYFEGDATGMETALTRTGRGRLPAFDMEYRALVLDGINYGYEKASARSLKDFVPNWYRQGYYMTTYARRHFGRDIWAGVVEDAVRYKGTFYPFSKSLERRTGLSTPALYEATYRELDSLWRPALEAKQEVAVNGDLVNTDAPRAVTHYTNPHYLDDGSVLAEKRGFDRIPVYVAIGPGGEETVLTRPGVLFSEPETTLSLAHGRLCWAELGFDARWQYRTYSIIKTYELHSGRKHKVTARTRLFSPDLSADGTRIVAVEVTEDMQYLLVILDAASGEVQQRLSNPEGYFHAYPRWTADGRIVAVANKDEESRLIVVDPATGRSAALTPPTIHQLTHPYPQGERIFFSAAYTGANNIFAVDLADGAIYQLTDVLTGAFQPSVSGDGERLLFSAFDLEGYDIRELALDEALWKPFAPRAAPFGINYFATLVNQEGGSIIDKVPDETFPSRKYNKWSGLINPHSLLPYIGHPLYGLQLLSDNKFSTLSASASGFFNVNQSEWSFLADLSYAEFFPIINARYRRSNRSNTFFNFAPDSDTTIIQTVYGEEWVENAYGGGLAVPLNLSAGNAFTRLTLGADYNRLIIDTDDSFDRPENRRDTIGVSSILPFRELFLDPIADGSMHSVDLSVNFLSIRRRALQHVNPRWGLNLGLRYRTTFGNEALQGDNLLARADFFLPGLRRDHSLFFNTMYQRQELLDNYRFTDLFFYPRGYPGQVGDEYYRVGVNYLFPLAYPDWELGPVAFVKRIKLNAFFDWGQIRYNHPFDAVRDIHSTGFELRFDFRLFRLLEVDAGVRYSYLLHPEFSSNGRRHQFDFLVISITE